MSSEVKKLINENLRNEEFADAYAQEKAKIQLANAIVEARKKKQLRQIDLTDLTGIKQSEISKIENALVYPNLSTLLKILAVLDLELKAVPTE